MFILCNFLSRDLNKGKPVRIGESIHKFCCYSFPLCPSEFFHNLNFPPSAKGVVGHFYKEVNNYDFAKGGRKVNIAEDQEIRHFTNIVWRKTTEIGCAQSKRNKKGCIYTVLRYRTEGSVGTEEEFKTNVHLVGKKALLIIFVDLCFKTVFLLYNVHCFVFLTVVAHFAYLKWTSFQNF